MSDRDEMTDNVNDEMIPLTLPRTKTVKFCEPWDATSKFEEALLCTLSVQLSILPPAVWCVSYRGSSGAARMPSSCICPRLSLCVLGRNGSNALSHSSLVSFYIRPSWRSVSSFADITEELSSALLSHLHSHRHRISWFACCSHSVSCFRENDKGALYLCGAMQIGQLQPLHMEI